MLVFGGHSSEGFLADMWLYSFWSGAWTPVVLSKPVLHRNLHRTAVLKESLWVYGGNGPLGLFGDMWEIPLQPVLRALATIKAMQEGSAALCHSGSSCQEEEEGVCTSPPQQQQQQQHLGNQQGQPDYGKDDCIRAARGEELPRTQGATWRK